MRQVILDTETTGLDPKQGHKVIEIGGIEMIDRRLTDNHFHVYINPEREVEAEALRVHGITNEFLLDKPKFADVAQDFVDFVSGAELIIHNAPFDIGFLNYELAKCMPKHKDIKKYCDVFDTLVYARKLHPGQRNNLDALCRRYFIDNSDRDLHGALLDSKILAQVYLAMTGGQSSLFQEDAGASDEASASGATAAVKEYSSLSVLKADTDEMAAHDVIVADLTKKSGVNLWHDENK